MSRISHHLVAKVVKLEVNIKERLDRLGEHKHRSPHWLMQEAIIRYLEEEEYKEQLNQETLVRWQEAENGKVVSHQAVTEWLDTWGTSKERKRPLCGK
jgi:predicted transcriptional regulator